ncbi:hypothetical protein EXIGLDRAFT_749645 [Exidia glandulosa HHB12029]|uniref:Uncharacterized protein n=1 Tax=Exidia glandulosa HHB12029 TaxID=1314781 RepID=A0A165HV71_EXIGL|nr:hypothetical protein EXIGLDRAFT_749645 [Exidia glandulosa HHB12029]
MSQQDSNNEGKGSFRYLRSLFGRFVSSSKLTPTITTPQVSDSTSHVNYTAGHTSSALRSRYYSPTSSSAHKFGNTRTVVVPVATRNHVRAAPAGPVPPSVLAAASAGSGYALLSLPTTLAPLVTPSNTTTTVSSSSTSAYASLLAALGPSVIAQLGASAAGSRAAHYFPHEDAVPQQDLAEDNDSDSSSGLEYLITPSVTAPTLVIGDKTSSFLPHPDVSMCEAADNDSNAASPPPAPKTPIHQMPKPTNRKATVTSKIHKNERRSNFSGYKRRSKVVDSGKAARLARTGAGTLLAPLQPQNCRDDRDDNTEDSDDATSRTVWSYPTQSQPPSLVPSDASQDVEMKDFSASHEASLPSVNIHIDRSLVDTYRCFDGDNMSVADGDLIDQLRVVECLKTDTWVLCWLLERSKRVSHFVLLASAAPNTNSVTIAFIDIQDRERILHNYPAYALAQLACMPAYFHSPTLSVDDRLPIPQLHLIAGAPLHEATVIRILVSGDDLASLYDFADVLLVLPSVKQVVFVASSSLARSPGGAFISAARVLHVLTVLLCCKERPLVRFEGLEMRGGNDPEYGTRLAHAGKFQVEPDS